MILFISKTIIRTIITAQSNGLKISEINKALHSRQLLVYSQHWKHQENALNLFKVNNKDTRTIKPIISFWCLYY